MVPAYDIRLKRKKSFVATLRQHPAFISGRDEKKNCQLSSVQTRIRNWHLQNKCHKCNLFNQPARLHASFLLGDYECVLFSKYCEYVCAIRWLFVSFYKCLFYCLSLCVVLWIFMLSFDSLCYYLNLLLFFECLCYSLKLLLFFECFFYSLSFYVIIRLFVLFSECLCYSVTVYVILLMILLFSECFSYSLSFFFRYSLGVLLLFECWLCLTSSTHHHNILFVDKVSRRLPIAKTQAQSHGDPYGISDDVRRIVCLSRIDSIPFSGTCDSDCEPCLEVTCRQAFLKSALEYSVKFIIPPLVHIHLPLLPKRGRRPD